MLENLKELNVLYVDDDTVACENMKNTLGYFFKNVFIENNGIHALDTYKKESIHLLLVDYDMPLMNGAEFLQEIRKVDYTIPAVIISSYSDKEKLMKAIKLNLVSYLTKPLEFGALKNVLVECEEWMEKHNLLQIKLRNNCHYDIATKALFQDDILVTTFTNYEAKIFEYLIKNRNKIISFDDMFYMLDSEQTNKKSLTTIIYKINKKLPTPMIKNIKEVGYTIAG